MGKNFNYYLFTKMVNKNKNTYLRKVFMKNPSYFKYGCNAIRKITGVSKTELISFRSTLWYKEKQKQYRNPSMRAVMWS